MPIYLAALLKRTMIGYLIVAICMVSLVGTHVHLSENHTGPDFHLHEMELHFTHFESGHDSPGKHVPHTTDATTVDVKSEIGTTRAYKILDVAVLAAAILILLVVPFRTEYRLPSYTTPYRSHPHYSPLQARAPPR